MVVLPMEDMCDWYGSNFILGANLAKESRHSSMVAMFIFLRTKPGWIYSKPPYRKNWTTSLIYANWDIFEFVFLRVRYFSSMRFSLMLVKMRVRVSTMPANRSWGQR